MGKTADYYNSEAGKESYKKKKAYDTKYHATEARKKYRRLLSKKNRELGSKVGDGLDASHTKKGGVVLESQSLNRARNRGKK